MNGSSPDEITGLIKRADVKLMNTDVDDWHPIVEDMVDALRALAQENERLKEHYPKAVAASCAALHERIRELEQENEKLQDKLTRQIDKTELEAERGGNIENDLDAARERIKELIEERNTMTSEAVTAKQMLHTMAMELQKIKAERDAIRRKTIEKCHEAARIAMQQKDWMNEDVLDAIRALAQTDKD